jgi:Endonuclease/Exonuclease/phosphatase family
MMGINISAVWLNTSFSPPRARDGRISDSEKQVFFDLLVDLTTNQKIDVIGLCELSKGDVALIAKEVAKVGYNVESGIVKAGRANFDTCILYRIDKLNFLTQRKEVLQEFDRTTKVGQLFIFEIVGESRPLYLFASHWPSRLYLSEYNPNRLMLGKTLRSSINQILTDTADAYKDSLVIVMGDFNDEPFDTSLTNGLASTRDKHLLKTNPLLLYNPFWRRLGAKDDYSYAASSDIKSGTYFYRGGLHCKWHTFDQIIVSSAFLGYSNWHLVESETEIVDFQDYTNLVLSSASKFDHLPVKIVLERV